MLGIQRHIIQIPAGVVKRTANLKSAYNWPGDLSAGFIEAAGRGLQAEWNDGVTDVDSLTTLVGYKRQLPAGSYSFTISGNYSPGLNSFSSSQFHIRANFVSDTNTGTLLYNSGTQTGGVLRTLSGTFTYTSATAFTISPVIYASGSTCEKPTVSPILSITEL